MEPAAVEALTETIIRPASQAIQRIKSLGGVGWLLLLLLRAARVLREPVDCSGIDTFVSSFKDGNSGSSCAPA